MSTWLWKSHDDLGWFHFLSYTTFCYFVGVLFFHKWLFMRSLPSVLNIKFLKAIRYSLSLSLFSVTWHALNQSGCSLKPLHRPQPENPLTTILGTPSICLLPWVLFSQTPHLPFIFLHHHLGGLCHPIDAWHVWNFMSLFYPNTSLTV